MGRIERFLFERFRNELIDLLKYEIDSSTHTLLDVGCGDSSKMEPISKMLSYTVGVDTFEESLNKGAQRGIHTEYRKMDVSDITNYFEPHSFDIVLAADLIEHVSKEAGFQLLRDMETLARKRVIVFTPNGFLPQEAYDGNLFQKHVSGWTCDEMHNLGFRVIGASGVKFIRGERAAIRYKPRFLWERVSWVSQPLVRRFPKFAFHIFCVKECGARV